jgi:hypothetical protein
MNADFQPISCGPFTPEQVRCLLGGFFPQGGSHSLASRKLSDLSASWGNEQPGKGHVLEQAMGRPQAVPSPV